MMHHAVAVGASLYEDPDLHIGPMVLRQHQQQQQHHHLLLNNGSGAGEVSGFNSHIACWSPHHIPKKHILAKYLSIQLDLNRVPTVPAAVLHPSAGALARVFPFPFHHLHFILRNPLNPHWRRPGTKRSYVRKHTCRTRTHTLSSSMPASVGGLRGYGGEHSRPVERLCRCCPLPPDSFSECDFRLSLRECVRVCECVRACVHQTHTRTHTRRRHERARRGRDATSAAHTFRVNARKNGMRVAQGTLFSKQTSLSKRFVCARAPLCAIWSRTRR